jgi:uncharacterized protein (DUF305 family)
MQFAAAVFVVFVPALTGVLSTEAGLKSCATGVTEQRRQQPPPIVQPGAPGKPGKVISAEEAARLTAPGITAADVAFMQGMISHHAQALEMTALLKTRTASDAMRRLAERIEVSQRDEIKLMQQWLRDHKQPVTDEHAHHAHGAALMPGMLTPDEMARLAAARGAEFDRLFLTSMIKHHQGALIMVKELFASPGAGQESEIHRFASDVDADQRMEIDRMAGMLVSLKSR